MPEPETYKKLANHLDNLPGGFPATESGVEIRILQRLFSSKEARIATALTMLPEPAETIAERLTMDVDENGGLFEGYQLKLNKE